MRHPTQPRAIGQILSDSLRKANLGRVVREGQLLKDWPQIVGPAVAQKAHPTSLKGKVLTVEVQDAAWRHQLSLMKLRLQEQINKAMGEEVVKDLFFIYGSLKLESREKSLSPKLRPLTKSQKESIAKLVEEASDPELKEILSSTLEKSFRTTQRIRLE
ncbi:MAG: DUF721 domain-containing protein [Deltaproteobacteria bacterium]|nr:DUF721 domain-containing protein [Deltaproteobacteria bacterium]